MRTASGIKAYLETTCYKLLRVKYDTWRRSRIVGMHAGTERKLSEDLLLNVDGYPIRCKDVLYVDTISDVGLAPVTSNVTTTRTHLEIVCRHVSATTRVWDPLDRHNDFSIPLNENLVVRWRDSPCFSLKYVKGLTSFSAFLAGPNLVHLQAKGQWLEFHDYIVGHKVQE